MELKEFVENLYELRKELSLYNLAKMEAQVSKLDIPKDKTMDEFEKFCAMVDRKMECEEKADGHELAIRLKAREMLDDLFKAGLRRADDLYELTELTRLERG